MEMAGRRERIPHYDDPVALGQRLYDARVRAGLSQRQISFPGCSAAYISRIERGERVPSLQVLRELARRVGVSEAELAFGRERLDPDVAARIREVEAAEAEGARADRARAYAALGRSASKVARALGQ
jgi:transcriptional regulator with XRE-family HTH domain